MGASRTAVAETVSRTICEIDLKKKRGPNGSVALVSILSPAAFPFTRRAINRSVPHPVKSPSWSRSSERSCRSRIASTGRLHGMRKPFVVISGLPGSGKTTMGRRLAPALDLPLIDKDDIMDRLFESKGSGNAEWRRTLSRKSDAILQQEATSSNGAIVVSFWRLPGMSSDSGTPTDWLDAPSHRVINLHCACEPEVAASRFLRRRRHPGHLDRESSALEVLASLRQLSQLPPLDIGQRIDVDTSREPNLTDVLRAIRGVLELPA